MSPRHAGRDIPPPRPLFQFGQRYLSGFAVMPETRAKYEAGCDSFNAWARLHGLQYDTVIELDEHLADYVNYMWCEDPSSGSFQRAGHAVYGAPFRAPQIRDHLPAAHLALRGWSRTLTQHSPPPISLEVATAIAVDLWEHGCHDAAIMVLLSHECYLRAREAIRLLVGDFGDASHMGLSAERGVGGIGLRHTKTGPNQFVSIRDPLVLSLLSRHCDGRPSTVPLFALSYSQYRHQFKDSLRRVGLDGFDFVLHSLRHGGATSDFCRNRPYDYIQLRGRWAHSESMVRYINAGAALSIRLRYSALTTRCILAAQLHTHAWFGFREDPRQGHTLYVG